MVLLILFLLLAGSKWTHHVSLVVLGSVALEGVLRLQDQHLLDDAAVVPHVHPADALDRLTHGHHILGGQNVFVFGINFINWIANVS